MAFFTFNQNNSGGVYIGAEYIFIEAANADEANDLALEHDIYFNGCDRGEDCECCGDRWNRVEDEDATEVPEIYGESAANYRNYTGLPPEIKIVRKTVDK